MKSNQRSAIWPYLIVLGCLFALSIAAPHGWQQMSSSDPQDAGQVDDRVTPFPPLPQVQEVSNQSPTIVRPEPSDAHAALTPPPTATVPAEQSLNTLALEMPAQAETPSEKVADAFRFNAEAEVALRDSQANNPLRITPQEVAKDLKPKADPLPSIESSLAFAPPAAPEHDWPLTPDLLQRLTKLQQYSECRTWAGAVETDLQTLHELPSGDIANATRILGHLGQLSIMGQQRVAAVSDAEIASVWRTAQYGLARRLDLWKPVAAARPSTAVSLSGVGTDQAMQLCIASLQDLAGSSPQNQQWGNYLMLDQIAKLAGRPDATAADQRRELAQMVLARLAAAPHVSPEQFSSNASAGNGLNEHLRLWTAQPISTRDLMEHVEQYETSSRPSDARLVADARRRLAWSSSEADQELGRRLENRYRNANLRIVVNRELINRAVPQNTSSTDEVNDTLVGVPIYGTSNTNTQLSVRLIPDQHKVRVGLEANGCVDSQTSASSGPVTFLNQGNSTFLVRKLVLISQNGLHVWPAVADANSTSDVDGLYTQYDHIPIVRNIVRNKAWQQRSEMEGQANAEAEDKVAGRASSRMDEEVGARLTKAENRFRSEILSPLQKMRLDPQAIDMSTTEDRVTMRIRLAADGQLAGSTARPQATRDSLASFQAHESVLNNILEQLEVSGRAWKVDELNAHIAAKLNRPKPKPADEDAQKITVTFADKDAMRVRFNEGRVQFTMAFKQLKEGSREWTDFEILTYYKVEANGLRLSLARDSVPFIRGANYKGRTEPRLRAIFSAALPREEKVALTPQSLATEKRLAGLKFSPAVVKDGWLATTIVPEGSNAATTAKAKPSAGTQSGNVARLPVSVEEKGAVHTRQ